MEPLVNESPLPAAQDSQPSGVAHTKPTQHASRPSVLAKGLNPGTSKVACSGQSEEAAGWGEEKGWPQEDTEGTQGPSAHRQGRQLRSADRTHLQRATGADSATQSSRRHGPFQTRLARTGEAGIGQGTGQGDRAVRSGDGADALSQERESVSNTHAKLRTKHTEEQTHTIMDPVEQTERPGDRFGQRWLPACL